MNWKSLFLFSTIASLCFVIVFSVFAKPSLAFNMQTYSAMAVGIFGAGATLSFFYALEKGEVSIVVPLTAMYPVVTVLLAAALLRERLSPIQGIGVVLAITAILLISIG